MTPWTLWCALRHQRWHRPMPPVASGRRLLLTQVCERCGVTTHWWQRRVVVKRPWLWFGHKVMGEGEKGT